MFLLLFDGFNLQRPMYMFKLRIAAWGYLLVVIVPVTVIPVLLTRKTRKQEGNPSNEHRTSKVWDGSPKIETCLSYDMTSDLVQYILAVLNSDWFIQSNYMYRSLDYTVTVMPIVS